MPIAEIGAALRAVQDLIVGVDERLSVLKEKMRPSAPATPVSDRNQRYPGSDHGQALSEPWKSRQS